MERARADRHRNKNIPLIPSEQAAPVETKVLEQKNVGGGERVHASISRDHGASSTATAGRRQRLRCAGYGGTTYASRSRSSARAGQIAQLGEDAEMKDDDWAFEPSDSRLIGAFNYPEFEIDGLPPQLGSPPRLAVKQPTTQSLI